MKELITELFSSNAQEALQKLQLLDNSGYEEAIDDSVFLLGAAKRCSDSEYLENLMSIMTKLCDLDILEVVAAYEGINKINISAFTAWSVLIFIEDVLLEYEDRHEQ